MICKVHNCVFFLFIVHVSYGVIQNNDTFECGALFNGNDSAGLQFSFRDPDQSINLVEDTRAGDSGWNVTTSAVVANDCKMKTCSGTYFTGECHYLVPGKHLISEAFSSTMTSVSCSCSKKCTCTDVHIKKSFCGRAYFRSGCQICSAPYTDLIIRSTRKKFPQKFSNAVRAIKLRAGCTLTIYQKEQAEDEEYEGNEEKTTVISQEITENFKNKIGSYKCECNDDVYVAKPKPPRPATYPPLLSIPDNMNQVIEMLLTSEYKTHIGLNAARRSYHNKRSHKNAYILLLGSTGAGKSSTINLLFDRPDITKVGDTKSTTFKIHEFRVPVAIDELGIDNSELRIIDTPGMGDTRGLAHDARYLATLENYLATHEELKNRIPNVVLIFHKFDDNRFEGEGSKFVQMIRGFDTFRQKVTDEEFSNVIFVFTHYMSVTDEEQEKPYVRIKQFKQVIEDFSLFPKPTHIVVAENKGLERSLPMANGFFQLPNYDYYPRNLFEKLDLITTKCGDPIGQGVFRTAFRDSENFNISKVDYPLINTDSSQVQGYLGILNHANLNVKDTNISRQLQHAWENQLDPDLKSQYPFSLAYLQKALNLLNINNNEDIPVTTFKILQLMTAIKQDLATRTLLEKGLGIQAPTFPGNIVVGHGYHIFKDTPLPTSPLKLGELQHSDIGYKIPSFLSCNVDSNTKENLLIFSNKIDYINYRFKSLGIEGNSSVDKYEGAVQPGCNIRALSFRQDGCNISATKDFRLFELVVNDEVSLHPDFEKVVRQLSPVNTSDYDSVKQWEDFFKTYGTHVVRSAYGGGSIQVSLQSDQPFNAKFVESIFSLIKFAEDLTYEMEYVWNGKDSFENATTSQHQNIGSSQSTIFTGGDPNFHSAVLGKMSITDASNLLSNWKRSLRLIPVMLQSEMKLVPISRIVKGLGKNVTSEIKKATQLLFESNLRYKRLPKKKDPGPGASRNQSPLAQEMMQEQNNQMQLLLMEIKKIEHENEKRRREMEEKRLKWQHNNTWMHTSMPGNGKEGCLKAGTLILMVNGIAKQIEELKVGDVILDMDLRPAKVLGVAREFLMRNRFYGFSRNGPFFFTSNHLFVGQSKTAKNGSDLQLFAKSTSDLYQNNPLMAYLNIKEFEESTSLFSIRNASSGLKVGEEAELNIYEDLMEYSENTLMYDLQVDSPSGTYFANGFACRHEIPPVEHWPNTMSLLFQILETPVFVNHLPNLPYTVDNVYKWHNILDDLVEKIKYYINSKQWRLEIIMEETDDSTGQQFTSLAHANVTKSISKLFKSPPVATVALRLYSRLGPVLALWLDMKNEFVLNHNDNVLLRNRLFEIITLELQEMFM